LLPAAAPPKISPTALKILNLWCGYADYPVLKDLSFAVARGEFAGILGPNGSGKSTLLLALSGVLPFQDGNVEILGAPLQQLKPRERARHMAVLTQDPEVRQPFTCEEVVRMGRYPHQRRWELDHAGDQAAVHKAMLLTDTQALAERLITAVSGGEKQRVTVAKALAQETALLLLDEATSAMDIHRKLQVFRVLQRLNEEDDLTILAVLHDVNLAALFCRRLIFIKEGRIIADGPVEEVLIPRILEDVYETSVLVQEVESLNKRQVVFIP
jgi:iron complex transport system ATP-binding protein